MKSQPSTLSWNDQLARCEDGEGWDGVCNHQASNNMKAMEIGSLAFFYHSVNEKQIVGIVEVCETYHPDPTDASGRFGMVTVKAVKPIARPVTLAKIKGRRAARRYGTGAPGAPVSHPGQRGPMVHCDGTRRDEPLARHKAAAIPAKTLRPCRCHGG